MKWFRVATLDEIPRLGARVVIIDEVAIALFRTSDDRVFALRDQCPHRGGPLSQGIVHGSCVTCPLHDWVIDLTTGQATGADEGSADRFEVRLEQRAVLVGVSSEGALASPRERMAAASQ
jgi:nitrite reductase (NADH) small subunit